MREMELVVMTNFEVMNYRLQKQIERERAVRKRIEDQLMAVKIKYNSNVKKD